MKMGKLLVLAGLVSSFAVPASATLSSTQIAAITNNFNTTTMLVGISVIFAVMATVAVAMFAGRKLLSVMRRG